MKNFKPPAFQFWAKDWLASPRRRMMSPTAQCAYINLLCTAWASDPVGTLPDAPDELWRLADISESEWKPIKNIVVAMFEHMDNFPDRLVVPKQREYFERLIERKEKNSKRGKKGADARWHRDPGIEEMDDDPDGEDA